MALRGLSLVSVAALAGAALMYLTYLYRVTTVPAVVMASASIVFGTMGVLVAARRLYFLAGAAPHASLVAALAAVPLYYATGLPLPLLVAVLGVLLVYTVGYAIFRGVDPDVATSVFVSVAASLSVILVYVIKSRYPLGFDIAALVFGDPLLASHWEAVEAAVLAAAVAVLGFMSYREQVYIGVDREAARLTGIRLWLYDLLFFTLLGAALSIMVRIVGFVLEHVLVLVPGALAGYASSSREALLVGLAASLFAGAAGLALGLLLNISPSGAAGLVLFASYLAAAAYRRR